MTEYEAVLMLCSATFLKILQKCKSTHKIKMAKHLKRQQFLKRRGAR